MMIHAVALLPLDEELTCSETTFRETSCSLSGSAMPVVGSNVSAMAAGTVASFHRAGRDDENRHRQQADEKAFYSLWESVHCDLPP